MMAEYDICIMAFFWWIVLWSSGRTKSMTEVGPASGARRRRASPPEAPREGPRMFDFGEKNAIYACMREYMPYNQVETNCV